MKKTALLALLLLATPLIAQPGPRGGQGNGPGAGTTAPAAPATNPFATYFASLPKETLSAAEAAEVVFLREEEKLARDVYRALFAAHGDRVFANIAGAEQRHMDNFTLFQTGGIFAQDFCLETNLRFLGRFHGQVIASQCDVLRRRGYRLAAGR